MQKKHSIEMLMEGKGGELVFQPIEATTKDLRKLVEAAKNPVIRHNMHKSLKEKGINL